MVSDDKPIRTTYITKKNRLKREGFYYFSEGCRCVPEPTLS